MRRWRLLVILLALTLGWMLAFAAWFTPRVAAAAECDAVLVDQAGLLGGQQPRVLDAAQALANLGATVRVRTVASLDGAATLDAYERNVERACPSWQAADGGRKNTLIVVLVAPSERATGLYYGDQWQPALGSNWTRVQADLMNPRFRDGDYAGGLAAGLGELHRLMDAQLHPAAAAPAPAPDWSGLGRVAAFALLALAALGAGFGLYRAGAALRAGRVQTRLAQQQARTVRRAVASRVSSYPSELEELNLRLDLLAAQAPAEEVQPLRGQLADARRLVDEVTLGYGTASDSVPDPDADGRSGAEYAAITAAYQPLVAAAERADEQLGAVRRQAADLERAPTRAPTAVAEARPALDGAAARVQAVAAQGFHLAGSKEILNQARAALERATAALGQQRFGEAQRQAGAVVDLASQAVTAAEREPALREAVEQRVAPAAARLDALRAAAERIAPYLVGHDAADVAERLDVAAAALDEARAKGAMEQQKWDAAQAALDQADAQLDAAEAALRRSPRADRAWREWGYVGRRPSVGGVLTRMLIDLALSSASSRPYRGGSRPRGGSRRGGGGSTGWGSSRGSGGSTGWGSSRGGGGSSRW